MKEVYYRSPNGLLHIQIEANSIVSLQALQGQSERSVSVGIGNFEKEIFHQLDEYFLGKRKYFDLSLKISGTDFQKKVWQEMAKIPYGETSSYGDIAKIIGGVNFSRAVGMACNKNPLLILLPCHRVVGKNGSLTGFAAGNQWKKFLLNREGVTSRRCQDVRLDPHH